MLSRNEARAICAIVASNPEANRRIDSNIDGLIPASWGAAGSIRNLGYVVLGMATLGMYADPSDKEFADRVCTGISDATAAAINAAVARKDARVRNVVSAVPISRVFRGVDHTATRVQMLDGQQHVIDWHATLDVANPLLFRTVRDWVNGNAGVTVQDFTGWD